MIYTLEEFNAASPIFKKTQILEPFLELKNSHKKNFIFKCLNVSLATLELILHDGAVYINQLELNDELANIQIIYILLEHLKRWCANHKLNKIFLSTKNITASRFLSRISTKCETAHGIDNYTIYLHKLTMHWVRHAKARPIAYDTKCPTDNSIALVESEQEIKNKLLLPLNSTVYSSPIKRAQDTARYIAQGTVSVHVGLIEFYPRELLGLEMKEIIHRYGYDFEYYILKEPALNKFTNSETAQEASHRIISTLNEIAWKHHTLNDLYIVSHQLIHNILLISLLKGDLNELYKAHLGFLKKSEFIYNFEDQSIHIGALNL